MISLNTNTNSHSKHVHTDEYGSLVFAVSVVQWYSRKIYKNIDTSSICGMRL